MSCEDGDLVPLEGRRLRAVWTPGHTPGHLCLYDEAADLLLTGDHVLPRITPNVGLQPHTAEPPLAAYLNSLRRVSAYADAEALPAHESASAVSPSGSVSCWPTMKGGARRRWPSSAGSGPPPSGR